MYKYNITFINGEKLDNKKISQIIKYIYDNKLDDGKYKYLYNRIAYNKNLPYIKIVERIKDEIIDTPQKKYYKINKHKILEKNKISYDPFKRKKYTEPRKEMHNQRQREKRYYIKSIDFLYNIDTNLFIY
jgi:hypothetical protein